VKLADDMGRTVEPSSDVRVAVRWRTPTHHPTTTDKPRHHACEENCEEAHEVVAVIAGASPFDDALLALDDEWDGDEDEDGGKGVSSPTPPHAAFSSFSPSRARLKMSALCMDVRADNR